ncbi:MAG TPA: histidine phosphatase family protein [Clostridia bacterium]|nr:histidine phosphatase family protein [Clostridia bacterium]
MTNLYFVRHAKPDFSIKDDLTRPLTEDGKWDCKQVTGFLLKRNITKVFSSPFKRAIDTIKDFSDLSGLEINIIEDFRERKVADIWIEDFDVFAEKQWDDFHYKISGGESLNEVQQRNIRALKYILKENNNENIVIGTHGTALSTIINYYDKNFGYSQFKRIKNLMPFIVGISFNGENVIEIEEFELKQKSSP